MGEREIAFSAISPLGPTVVCYTDTLIQHRITHPEPFTDEEAKLAIEDPSIIALTGHDVPGHEGRYVYYRDETFRDKPTIMKVVVDHASEPCAVASLFRTDKRTKDKAIAYIKPDFFERRK